MPKREPPIEVEDDSKYLTVVHPYPLNANLHMPTDKRALALWLACCTGKAVLRAMYHKPTSAGMVIVEVDGEFKRWDVVLGKHSWSDFLLAPTEEEAANSSEVFFCTYSTNRAVQDGGWKRVDIEEHWFQGWRPDNDTIKFPYPKTIHCNVPSEAMTGAPMCRPLPRLLFLITEPLQESPGVSRATSPEGPPRPPSVPVSPKPISHMNGHHAEQGSVCRGPPPFASVAGPTPTSCALDVQVDGHTDEEDSRLSTAADYADLFGTAPRVASVTNDDRPFTTDEGVNAPRSIPARDEAHVDGDTETEENPWDTYYMLQADTQKTKKGEEAWICPEHGPRCDPGICEARGWVESDDRWKKETEARQEAKRKRLEERERRRDQERSDESEEDDIPEDQGPGAQPPAENPEVAPQPPTTTTDVLILLDEYELPSKANAAVELVPVVPPEGGFPTYADAPWADPIAAAQFLAAEDAANQAAQVDSDADSTKSGKTDEDGEGSGSNSGRKPGQSTRWEIRRRPVVLRVSASTAASAVTAARVSDLESFDLGVLPPGGPGESWGESGLVW